MRHAGGPGCRPNGLPGRVLVWALGGATLTLIVAGCGTEKRAPVDPSYHHLEAIYGEYRECCLKRANAEVRSPSKAEDLTELLKTYGDPSTLLISPTDGQPYEIVWGVTLDDLDPSEVAPPRILAHERKGDGRMHGWC